MSPIVPAYCYIARVGGLTKVGFSFNPEHRMTILERQGDAPKGRASLKFTLKFNPYKVAYNAEALTKGHLARYLAAGHEWFDVDYRHAIDVLIASGERAFDSYCQKIVVEACNHGHCSDEIKALGLQEWVELREYPTKWLRASEAALAARRRIRMMGNALKSAA